MALPTCGRSADTQSPEDSACRLLAKLTMTGARIKAAAFYVVLADLDAPTGFRQAFAFAAVVTMRLASLRWGLHTPLPDDLVHKLTPKRHQGHDAPQGTTGDTPH
jgi:hypothetical protein